MTGCADHGGADDVLLMMVQIMPGPTDPLPGKDRATVWGMVSDANAVQTVLLHI